MDSSETVAIEVECKVFNPNTFEYDLENKVLCSKAGTLEWLEGELRYLFSIPDDREYELYYYDFGTVRVCCPACRHLVGRCQVVGD